MSRSRILIVVGLIGISLLLSAQQQRISDLRQENTQAAAIAFRQQLNPGFACGILSTVEARTFLGQQDVIASGTIIPADAPTAASREGSPRLDSCAYSLASNNLSYIDIIVKTYDGSEIAKQAYKKQAQGVMYAKNGNLQSETTSDTYSAGVHYIQRDRYNLEISASKVGAAIGPELEAFSDSVAKFVLNKL